MAASIRTTRVAAITAGGPTQDVTISGFGTPTAVVVRYVKATADDTVVGNAAMGGGIYDGTSPVCCFSHSITGGASASNGRGNDFSGSWFIRSFASGGADDARASVAFITDGVRLTWDLLPPAGWLMTFTFITGTDAEYCAHVDNAAGDVDVTAAGFQPNFILTIGANTGSFPSSSFDITEGYCVEDSGVVSQGSFSWWEQSGASNCSPMVVFDTAASKRVMFGGGLIGGIAWTDFDANGATAAQVNADGCDAIYLMLKFPAAQEVGIFSDSVTTSTGNTTIGPGGSVVPAFIEGCFAALTPAMDNTWRGSSGDPEAGVISLFSYDGTTQICNTLFLDESTDPVVTDSVSRSGSVFDSADDNQANAWVGTASAFTAGGMTVNITAAPATERRIFGWYLEAATGGGVTVGTATESDTALDPSIAKQLAAGVASETDTAPALALVRSLAVGVASETSTALESALGKQVPTGIAEESNAAIGQSIGKRLATGHAEETSTAFAASLAVNLGIGIAAETDSAQPATLSKTLSAGVANETDAAFAPTFALAFGVGVAEETDSALSVALAKQLAAAVATETDAAQATAFAVGVNVTAATETDAALTLGLAKAFTLGVATETDGALGVALTSGLTAGVATETDASVARALSKALTASPVATETDTALALSIAGGLATTAAAEADSALQLTLSKQLSTSVAAEAQQALTPTLAKVLGQLPSVETSAALSLALHRAIASGVSGETDTARALHFPIAMGLATEVDLAIALDLAELILGAPGTGAWTKGATPGTGDWSKTATPGTGIWVKH